MKGALDGLDRSKLRIWLTVGIAAAALLLIATTFMSGPPTASTAGSSPKPESAPAPAQSAQDLIGYEDRVAQQVQSALSAIQGAGKVRVALNLQGGPSYLYAFDQTTSRQQTGTAGQGTTTTQTQLATAGSGQSPVLTQEMAPKVIGALVVATGARDPLVRQELVQAAQALLGLPAYAIEVLPGGVAP